jgi:arabinan endo-1,5-alpha-L-arabinosidase
MVVASNNAIDPAPLIDGSDLWLAYGNWQTGIDLIQLDPANGLRLNAFVWDLVAGQVEGPYLMQNAGFYYLFFQRGLCCNGVNSTYYTQVGRATSVTGPYIDQNGNGILNGGGTTFLPNRDGRFIGPGHVGYGEGKLTYHFYDGDDNGNAKLKITTLSWSNGWPVADGVNLAPPQVLPGGTYSPPRRSSRKYQNNPGSPVDGSGVGEQKSGKQQ